MANFLFVCYLIALSIGGTIAYEQKCAGGPEYWCKSFENAQDCGAIHHCTDTVWNNDNKYTLVDSSTTCQWCQKVLAKTEEGLQIFGNLQDLMVSTLTKTCKLLPSTDLSSKCTNVVDNYGTSVISLMKNKRYATLCHLMSICSIESTSEKPPVNLGQRRCTWGPSYWCSSLSNTRECNSIDHCSDQIWSQQAIEKKENDNICKYCEVIIEKLRLVIHSETINVEQWLSDACSMLQVKDAIDKCVQTMSQYADEIVALTEKDIDPGVICHLGQMCTDATIVTRTKDNNKQPEDKGIKTVDEQSKMLCNVIVRATHDLYVKHEKSQNEIETFLKNDCLQLSTMELTKKCGDLVAQYGNDIYGHVANNMELSKVCDYIGDLADPTALQSLPHVHCELCTFVLATTKHMLDFKQSEDKILLYIDEQLCSRLNGDAKKNCKYMIETNREDLIDNIQRGTQSMLVCTYFQVCIDEIVEGTSPIQKNEMHSFLKENLCDHAGPFEETCNAIMETDTTRLLKTLVNYIDGDVLCQMVGICPTKMSFIDELSINDDKNKCARCIIDFTRRKHIAEKLVNHSSEFLHHLCGQLPQEDDCIKSVDESINKLREFIQSLNPEDICLELKMCNETLLENMHITLSDEVMGEEMVKYIKNEICNTLGPISKLCIQLMDTEGANLFKLIAKHRDPHQVCAIIDVCPKTTGFENCNDKCECCISKMENYQVRLASFLQTMLTTARAVCEHMPSSSECREVADGFETNINELISHFNAKRVCQALTHCSSAPVECNTNADKCQCCQNHMNSRKNNFRKTNNEIVTTLLSLCDDTDCRLRIQSNQQDIFNKIDKIDSLAFCQRFDYCSSALVHRSIPYLSNLMGGLTMEEFADNLCSQFGDSKAMCEHFITSAQSDRYVKVYNALMQNNLTLIDEDFHEQITDTCDGCKSAVQSSKDFWMNSLESVRNVLLKTCEHCPSKDQCQDLINQRFDNLKSYLDKIDPEEFCQTIHLCSVSLTNTCSTCIESLQLRKDGFLQAIDRLAGYFNDLCQQHAGKQCQIYVNQLHDSIQKSIEEFNPKETCNSIGFCSNDEADFDQYGKYLVDEIEKNICSTLGPFEILCKHVIKGDTKQIQTLKMNYDIKDLMKIGGESPEDFNKCSGDECKCCIARVNQRKRHIKFIGDSIFFILMRSCDTCPARGVCRTLVRIAKSRFNAHIDHICPYKVCVHLGFCNQTSQVEKPAIKQIDDSNSTCILCEYVMNILSNYIHRQSTEKEIEDNLQKVCNEMPTVLQNQCHDYINNYGPSIIAILLQEFDVSAICHKLNLCTKQMKVDVTHLIKADTATCGICDYISTYFHFELQRDSKEKSFQHALSTVCSHLSEEQKPKCQTIIQLFSPHIHQLELSPGKSFCKQLTICLTPMIQLKPSILLKNEPAPEPMDIDTLLQPNIKDQLTETPKCALCHYVISYLDAALKNNISEQAVEQALEKVCTILPAKERDQCNQFIEAYGAVLANMIAEMVDPLTICRTLGMCDGSSTQKPAVLVQTPHTCFICQLIINRMRYFRALKQGETEALVSLKEYCNLFSVDNLKEQCKDFLNQYGSHFSKIISTDIESKPACQNIGICIENNQKSTVTPSSPVSSSTKYGKCIFGMKYWCSSRANAELCGAVELCQRQVWSQKNIVID